MTADKKGFCQPTNHNLCQQTPQEGVAQERMKQLTLKNSHLFSERVTLRMGTTLIMELGYQMRPPSQRLRTVMLRAISSTWHTPIHSTIIAHTWCLMCVRVD